MAGITRKKVLLICLALAIIIGLLTPVIIEISQPFQEIMYSRYLEEKKQLRITKVTWDIEDPNTVLIQAQSNYNRTFNITSLNLWFEDQTYGYEEIQLPQTYNVSSILRPGAPITFHVKIDGEILQPGNYGVILQTDRMPYWSYPGLTVSSKFPLTEPSPRQPSPTPLNLNAVKITKLSWDTSTPKTLRVQVQSFSPSTYNITRVQFWHQGLTETTHGGTWADTIVNVVPTSLSPYSTETVEVNLEEGVLQPGTYKVCILIDQMMYWYSGFLEVQ